MAAPLIIAGRVRRSVIGISGQTVPLGRRMARYHRLDQSSDVRFFGVIPGEPAARAGMLPWCQPKRTSGLIEGTGHEEGT